MASLPTETLCDIFQLVVAAATPRFRCTVTLVQTELERVANAPLLRLSQVSSRWHEIAMNTPTLWSNVEVNDVTGRRPVDLENIIQLLTVRLERTRDAPLSVFLRVTSACEDIPQPPHPRIFSLLAQHSHRWQTARILCSLEGLDPAVVRGRLPRLKNLMLNVPLGMGNFFGIAPCLRNLTVTAPAIRSESLDEILRKKQLQSFGCLVRRRGQFRDALSLLPELPFQTHFYLSFDLVNGMFGSDRPTSLSLPSITAQISSLACGTVGEFNPDHSSLALGQAFDSLTVPNVRRVLLGSSVYPRLVLEWPHTHFLAFSQRSRLDTHLKLVCIAEVRITESDLLEVLSFLKVLEHLEIGDPPRDVDEPSDAGLITDSFLHAMLWTPGQDCLVPCLSHFACVSRLTFTHSLVIDLVESRLNLLTDSSTIFQLCIHPFPSSDVRLDAAVHTRLWELAAKDKQFFYRTGEKYITLPSSSLMINITRTFKSGLLNTPEDHPPSWSACTKLPKCTIWS
ncbi:hypothetical protein B0H16DRAFT_1880367, partial [Mycena metata]